MALNCFNPVLLFIFVSFLNFLTIEAKDLHHFCSENITTANITYQANRKTLFASLSSKATVKTFYNDTVGGTVYGLFMCRGDVPSDLCGQCVLDATQTLSSECYLSRWAIIWYDGCMVRYSNSSFFSIVETSPSVYLWSYAVVSNQASFMPLLNDIMNKTTNEAAFSPNGDRYATKETKVSENQTLYCLAQCTRDLSPQRCSYCLADAIGEILGCCGDKHQGGRVMLPSCNVRYELYPFYQVNAPRQGSLVPATKYSKPESYYLSHDCSIYKSLYSDFEEKLMILLSYLSSNATSGSGNNGFYKTDADGRVFGLYMCRLDIPPDRCGQCVVNATHLIASQCSSSSDALVWYNHCLLRYSDQSFFNKMSTSPSFEQLNVTSVYNVESSFKFTRLSNALAEVVAGTPYNDERYQAKSLVLNGNQTIYILAQCTQDLSAEDCSACLSDVIGSAIPWSRLGSVGGRVLYPSCTLRSELFKFYSDDIQAHAPPQNFPPPARIFPPSPSPAPERKDWSLATILIIVAIVVLVLLSFCCYLLWRKARKSYILRENFGHESTMVEQLQLDLAIIKAATNNFSHENRIGKGGFGEVYKGVLLDGQHIAAKRLSESSTQGVIEFKNEVLLIAKLQHRNLVAFIGFCLEDQEKILIYEYVPNKSLDYFLFDAHSGRLLNWSERYKIIGGVARGILYLHEYSRLKVIHRDLKPSNVLLDKNMNPKISDFGLARIIDINQQQGSTNRIVGTLGYMPPEYAMLGQFSEKSDVFSFGVMLLEIITGKKNIASYESQGVAEGLLSSVWRQYRNQTPLRILDPRLRGNCYEFEVTRCTQIGLLCVQENPDDRPTMIVVVSYFSNHSIELPSPREPAFSLRHEIDLGIVAHDPSSSSINMMSTTNIFPR